MSSTQDEIDAAWDQEIARRVAAYERGETGTYSADVVFAEARRLCEHAVSALDTPDAAPESVD
jgi:hypothetical protein